MTASPDAHSIICAGRIYCDLLFSDAPRLPSFGTETFAGRLEVFAGGGAFITAATFCALGRPAALFGTLPAAPFGPIVERDIAKSGVDFSRCAAADIGSGPQVTVAIAGENDRAFLSHRAGVAIPPLSEEGFSGFGHLHIGELRTLCEHPELIAFARRSSMTISLDCGWDDELMTDPSGLEVLISSVDVFLPNDSEYAALLAAGLGFGENTLLAVKCGAAGAWGDAPNGPVHAETVAVAAVDTTGAGDAFNAGFISAWLAGDSMQTCLEQGNRCGRVAVSMRGGTAGLAYL